MLIWVGYSDIVEVPKSRALQKPMCKMLFLQAGLDSRVAFISGGKTGVERVSNRHAKWVRHSAVPRFSILLTASRQPMLKFSAG